MHDSGQPPGPATRGERPAAAPGDGYDGPAGLTVGQQEFEVHVHLRGLFQPIDGRYRWYGRVDRHAELTAALRGGRAAGLVTTPAGTAPCELSDLDPWHRYRITGISTPPFRSSAG
jgi:hypothetical protein